MKNTKKKLTVDLPTAKNFVQHRFGMVVLNGSCFTDDPDSDLGWKSPFACKEP